MRAICFSSLAALLLGGCGTVPQTAGTPESDQYMVTSRRAYFYQFGPAQGSGPDFVLARGARVKMIKHDFGFSQIKTADGELGYVATSDVSLAPPEPPLASGTEKSRKSRAGSRPPSSLIQPNDSALPDGPQKYTPSPSQPAPSFRY